MTQEAPASDVFPLVLGHVIPELLAREPALLPTPHEFDANQRTETYRMNAQARLDGYLGMVKLVQLIL